MNAQCISVNRHQRGTNDPGHPLVVRTSLPRKGYPLSGLQW